MRGSRSLDFVPWPVVAGSIAAQAARTGSIRCAHSSSAASSLCRLACVRRSGDVAVEARQVGGELAAAAQVERWPAGLRRRSGRRADRLALGFDVLPLPAPHAPGRARRRSRRTASSPAGAAWPRRRRSRRRPCGRRWRWRWEACRDMAAGANMVAWRFAGVCLEYRYRPRRLEMAERPEFSRVSPAAAPRAGPRGATCSVLLRCRPRSAA